MTRKVYSRRLAALAAVLALVLTLSGPAYGTTSGMGNFKKVAEYTGFPDVDASAWYAADVRKAYELGIINGKAGGYFDPTGNITLAEAITMAAKVAAIYNGDAFVPGGSPWYENAVRYAVQEGITYDGEYLDYSMTATRADLAGLLSFTLPAREFARINRVAWIPDVTFQTHYANYIYQMYNAGVLTGNAAGSFQPDSPITRAEAAAIINRVAVPSSRKSFSLTTHAPGEVVTSANGNFQVCVPQNAGWVVDANDIFEGGSSGFSCRLDGGTALFEVVTFDKHELEGLTSENVANLYHSYISEDLDGTIEKDIYLSLARGLVSYAIDYTYEVDGVAYAGRCHWVENSTNYYMVELGYSEHCTDAQYAKLYDLFYSFDMAL
ncbi:hypothetical protein CE91St41_33080 [Oscillospiraceae bacterium]|nr:hypothetical protein CE91St40_33070 [Oscillospiraceae bacterium]BDF76419.1 hypothetical protein CE91St41_33080 [Oscillospiraceae bacterium]